MKMYIKIQCATKTLDQGHGAGLCRSLCETCLACQVRGNGAVDDAQHPGHDMRVTGKQKAERERQAELPLTHGFIRQDSVNQKCSAVGHAARTTTGAETSLLTAEGDQFFIVAGFAPHPEKTVLQPSALQILIKFFRYICRQVAAPVARTNTWSIRPDCCDAQWHHSQCVVGKLTG